MEIRIVRESTKRELWRGDSRIFLAVIGDSGGWGECSEEVAERDMLRCLMDWTAQNPPQGGRYQAECTLRG